MMRALTLTLVLAHCIALATGCGSEQGGDDDACEVTVQLEPGDAVAPVTIVGRATVEHGLGVLAYEWTVTRNGRPVEVTPRTPESRDVEFVAPEAGVYLVRVIVPGCDQWDGGKNVRDPRANENTVRLRFTPAPGSNLPGQERIVTVPGGADFAAGVINLDGGLSVPIVVHDARGANVPSYVRLTSRATPDVFVELTTSSAGTDVVRLLPGRADVLVIPLDSALAPRRLDDWAPLVDSLEVDAGTVATGVVQAPSGAPVVGARVALAGDAPSTIATTASDGSFTLRYRGAPPSTLTVVPPATSGLPRLSASLVGLDLTQPLTVSYAPGLIVRDLTGTPVRIDGVAAGAGAATIAIDVADAGTVGDGTTAQPATGKHRDTVAVDGAGRLTAYRATAAPGRVYLRAATGPGAVVLVDLTTAAPIVLDGAGPEPLAITVVDGAGQPIADAQLRATLTGDLAHLAAPAPTATTDALGHATVTLAPGAIYQLDVVDPRRDHAAAHLLASAGTSLEPIELADAIAIDGEVRATGQSVGLPSVGVTALCYACTGLDRTRPLGDAVTDLGGRFVVAVPDPGTGP